MLTLFHARNSRSSRIITLIEEMGITEKVDLHLVDIFRFDGSGRRDPANPHPEDKVPALLHNETLITESAAIILYLTDLFSDTGMAPLPGSPTRGAYLTWLFWYRGVMEPVLICERMDVTHPALNATFRGHAEVIARLNAALQKGPWLLGDHYSAADLLCRSPYAWFSDAIPDDPLIRDWVARCEARPAQSRSRAIDARPQAEAAA